MTYQLLSIIYSIGNFYVIMIIVHTIMTWFPMNGALYDIYRVLGSLVEPYVGIFRRFIPPMAGLDFSPWAAILAVQFVIVPVLQLLVRTLVR